ncbi:putative RNA methyltransferase [Gammaproteobacteria bacterium AS21]
MNSSVLACPLCREPLEITGNVMRCANNHCFDQAKQGYWNLLAVQQKKSIDPGDNPLMVNARGQFLDLQYYRPLADTMSSMIADISRDLDRIDILDMGCGDGYYTEQWQAALSTANPLKEINFYGLDISKHAIKAATKRTKDMTWIVASGSKMPIKDNSLDILSVVFSRLMPGPFAKALKTNASLILVWPTDQHLIELKQVMYNDIKTSSYEPALELEPLFALENLQVLKFNFVLTAENQLSTLLDMTPHGQRINNETKQSLLNRLPLELTFSVNIGQFSKR